MPALGLLPGMVRTPGLPQLPLQNMWAREAVTEPTGFNLLGRPRLQNYTGVYDASYSVIALFQADGIVSGNTVFILSDGSMYIDGTDEGTVSGSGHPSIAGNAVGVIATRGGDAKFWDGTTFRSIAFPDSDPVLKVLDQQSRFIFLESGTQRYYWTEPGSNMLDGSGDITIDSLDFASAESEPDQLVDGLVYRDHLVLAGTETIELHAVTGNDDAPWAPVLGSTIQKGVGATGCMTKWNNTFAWIDPAGVVWAYDAGQGRRISTPGIEELLKRGFNRMDSFTYDGRDFLRIWADTGYGDLVFDAWTEQWAEWTSDPDGGTGGTTGAFVGGPPARIGDDTVFGSKDTGRLLTMNSYNTYAGGYAETDIEYKFRCGMPMDAGEVVMHNLGLRCRTGLSQEPDIDMRFSRDLGTTWSSTLTKSLGASGNRREKVEWRSLGMMDQPGFLAEFSTTFSPTLGSTFNVSGAYFNEFTNGRAR